MDGLQARLEAAAIVKKPGAAKQVLRCGFLCFWVAEFKVLVIAHLRWLCVYVQQMHVRPKEDEVPQLCLGILGREVRVDMR